MMPVFEQGHGQGIGHTYDTFLSRFIEICENHLKDGRAKAFAFILYDFYDESIKEVLRSQGGFAKLDRISGNNLSLFYLNSDDEALLKTFNDIFIDLFDISSNTKLPFVLFFKLEDRDAKNVEIVELEQSNIMFAFDELYRIIEEYINDLNKNSGKKTTSNKFVTIIQFIKKTTGEKLIEYLVTKTGDNFF